MKLSIIICVYNTDKEYLRAALESIRNSTLRDYEICMVDDGSAEDYTALAAEFGARLQKTPNGGILRARLNGIEMAEGDYLAFFDSDDSISIHYHQAMMEVAEKANADIVINAWAFQTETSRYYCRRDSTIARALCAEGDDVLRAFAAQKGREHSYYVTWNKIYRKELLKNARAEILKTPLAQAEKSICFGEDVLFNFYAFRDAKKMCNVHTGYYFYRIHANQSVNVISEERLRSQIIAMGQVFELMEAGIGDNCHRDEILACLGEWRKMMSRTHCSHAKGAGYEGLYPLIQKTYGVDKLRKSTARDGAVYTKAGLLPQNFCEIDAALRPLFDESGTVKLCYHKRDAYTERVLGILRANGLDLQYDRNAAYRIPKQIITMRDRIIHNDVVYAVSVRLFPKGSKIRALLKRLL